MNDTEAGVMQRVSEECFTSVPEVAALLVTPPAAATAQEIVAGMPEESSRLLGQLLIDHPNVEGALEMVKRLEQYLGKLGELGQIEREVAVTSIAAQLVLCRIDELKRSRPMLGKDHEAR